MYLRSNQHAAYIADMNRIVNVSPCTTLSRLQRSPGLRLRQNVWTANDATKLFAPGGLPAEKCTRTKATREKKKNYCVCNKTSITPHIWRIFAVRRKQIMLILLIILILVFGFGGYRMGPGLGYYGGGGISLILLIVLILLLLKVI
jgi:hypothetical protein